MRRSRPLVLVLIAGVLTLLLLYYVFAGGTSGERGPPADRLSDRQAGAGNADDAPPANPWATLPGSEGGEMAADETAMPGDLGVVPGEPPPPPPPPPPAAAQPAPAAPVRQRAAAGPSAPRMVEAPAATGDAARPSFNCRNARTRGEIVVCRDAGLASLDRQMAGQFNRAMGRAGAAQRAQLQRTRSRFLARRDSCATEACMAEAYRARMREIGSIGAGSRAAPSPPPAAAQVQIPVARPSFDCRQARTRSEVAICDDARLAGLDRQMAGQYGNAVRQATDAQRDVLERSRMRFLTRRERCGTAACIADAYRGRMREIDDIIARHWRAP